MTDLFCCADEVRRYTPSVLHMLCVTSVGGTYWCVCKADTSCCKKEALIGQWLFTLQMTLHTQAIEVTQYLLIAGPHNVQLVAGQGKGLCSQ